MPNQPRAACPEQPCPHFQPCPVHPVWGEGLRRSPTRFYSSLAWRKLRDRVLAEEPRCRFCGARSTDADHIIARRAGGSDERSNLRGLCHSCHSRRTLGDCNAARRR